MRRRRRHLLLVLLLLVMLVVVPPISAAHAPRAAAAAADIDDDDGGGGDGVVIVEPAPPPREGDDEERHELQLPGRSAWRRCLDGRGGDNLVLHVHAEGRALVAGIADVDAALRCSARRPALCRLLARCMPPLDAGRGGNCSRFFPGELSKRVKCIVLLNPGKEPATARVRITLASPGSWLAIKLGVAVVTAGLAAVVGVGLWSDLAAIAAERRQRRLRRLASRHQTEQQQQQQAAAAAAGGGGGGGGGTAGARGGGKGGGGGGVALFAASTGRRHSSEGGQRLLEHA